MHRPRSTKTLLPAVLLLAMVAVGPAQSLAQKPSPRAAVTVIDVRNRDKVEITPAGAQRSHKPDVGTILDPGDRGRTFENASLTLRLSDLSVMRIRENSVFEIQAPPSARAKAGFTLLKGLAYFFGREKPLEIHIRTRSAVAAIRGTEFAIQAEDDGRTVLTLFDGTVELSNLPGETITLQGREQAIVEPGQAPRKTAVLDASGVIQWFLYYPGVLDLEELPLSSAEQETLAPSLAAYRRGNLPQALARYPADRRPASASEQVYLAALWLSASKVEAALKLVEPVKSSPDKGSRSVALAAALTRLIEAVKTPGLTEPADPDAKTQLASVRLAESYAEQARLRLPEALAIARQVVQRSPNFAFGWARVAQLEFSFGHLPEARSAVERSLALAPENAEALALKGFLAAADNRIAEAISWFDRATAVDGQLANAWLGRGLCYFRQGRREAGRAELSVAAALEPERSLLRSYLAKAWSETGRDDLAHKELKLAQQLDPGDPTPWLYSALLARAENRINPAVDELERSVELNKNRQVYRSQFLLDEDLAVRSSSLANIYQSAGMNAVSVREAARAVTYDYANYSAHQFLAESYDALRDPTRFNLRYETPWFSEWLLANLLSPVGGTPLSQHISQQEYARFFERNRLGLVSQTEYRSDGQVREIASQFGNYRNFGYAIDLDYQHNDGVRPNHELDRLEIYGTFKYQFSPRDSVLLLTKFQNYHSGDNFQYIDPSQSRTNFYYHEYQTPGALVAGYHREWAPGVHTLVLGGYLANDQRQGDLNSTNYLAIRNATNQIAFLSGAGLDVGYRNEFELFTGELNQIFQGPRHTLVLGARYQAGSFATRDQMLLAPAFAGLAPFFPNPPAADDVETDFERITGYAYWTWELLPRLWITPGLAYDTIRYPDNHRHPPVSSAEASEDQFSPKAAAIWSPSRTLSLRGVYTRSLGGVSYDESYRLEPTQLAGFPQSFRTVMPESLVGSVSAPEFETAGVGLDLRFKTRTYVTLQGEWIESKVDQTLGDFESPLLPFFATPWSLAQQLRYRERSFALTINQLVAKEWAFGAGYKFTRSELRSALPEVPLSVYGGAQREDEGDFHQVSLFGLYNHPAGWFGRADLNWYIQSSSVRTYPGGSALVTAVPDEEFPQLNLLVGFRFKRQRGEIAIGGLNLTGENYRLNPISLYEEFPRERVFYARVRFRF